MKNKMSIFKEELEQIVKKYKNGGKDPIPYLTDLAAKYNGFIKNLIMVEICSYTILFTDNLRSSVEQFIKLIEQPEIANSSLITVSIFYLKYIFYLFIYLYIFLIKRYFSQYPRFKL